MKIRIPCMACLQVDGMHPVEFQHLELEDIGVYQVICSKGHASTVFDQSQKFEVLFELGSLSLVDENTHSAVAYFVSSLERFHEFCIRVFNNEKSLPEGSFEKMWKFVCKQSERQLGAFCFLYLSEFKELPPKFIMDQKNVSFRNEVLHNGYIPKSEEVFEYGSKAFDYMNAVTLKMKSKFANSIDEVCMKVIEERHSRST